MTGTNAQNADRYANLQRMFGLFPFEEELAADRLEPEDRDRKCDSNESSCKTIHIASFESKNEYLLQ